MTIPTHVRYGKKLHPVTKASEEITSHGLEAWGETSHPVWFNGRFFKTGFPVKDGKMFVLFYEDPPKTGIVNYGMPGKQVRYQFDAPPPSVKTITPIWPNE